MWSLCNCPAEATYGAIYYAVLAVCVVLAYAAGRYYNMTTTQELKDKYKKLENDYGAQEIVLKTQAAEAEVCFVHHNLIEKIYHTQPKTRKRKEEELKEADSKFHTNPNCPGLNATKESEELVYRLLCQHCSKRLEKGKTS